jgi:small-conductance mechanosensitive channel
VLRHVQVTLSGTGHATLFGTGRAATTLTGSCTSSPGVACRLVWDLTHNGQLASLTTNFLAGPFHLLLRVAYVVVLALIVRALLHRLINRITERAADSILPQFRGGVRSSLVASRLRARRRHRGTAADVGDMGDMGDAGDAAEVADVTDAADSVGADAAGGATVTGPAAEAMGIRAAQTGVDAVADASPPEIAAAAASAERALIDERRHQRVRALGSILRSAASVTVFAIAGVVVLGDIGINLAPLLASAGVVGVAIGFGAQNLVRDYLAGVFMLLEDQYGVGDVITVGDATGTVETVTLRITRMRDVNGIVWHVRNGTIEKVGNESQGWARAVIDFPVPYAADLTTIRSVLSDTALSLWNEPVWRAVMLEEPEVWGAQEVSTTVVTMRIVVKTAPLRQWEVEREMRVRVKAALDVAGIGQPADA